MNGCPVLRSSKSNTWSCLLWQPTGNMGAAEKRGFVCRGREKKSFQLFQMMACIYAIKCLSKINWLACLKSEANMGIL